jgi:hypothetical protein
MRMNMVKHERYEAEQRLNFFHRSVCLSMELEHLRAYVLQVLLCLVFYFTS